MRKTSKSYRKELNGFKKNIESTEAHITARLIHLVEKFPDAIVLKKKSFDGDVSFKAKCVTKSWIDGLAIETQLNYIESIEEHTASLEKHRQVCIYE